MLARSGVESQPRLDELALAVAADRDRAIAQCLHGIDGLARERAARDVAADDDQIDAEALDLGQHRGQRGVVAMDVVERRDSHYGRCPLISSSMSAAARSSASAVPSLPV